VVGVERHCGEYLLFDLVVLLVFVSSLLVLVLVCLVLMVKKRRLGGAGMVH